MRKTIVTLLAAAACAAPFAQAEGNPVSVELTYDSALLATEDGAKEVLESIEDKAVEACAYKRAITGTPTFDRTCRDNLVEQAVAQISEAASSEGFEVAYVFASVE